MANVACDSTVTVDDAGGELDTRTGTGRNISSANAVRRVSRASSGKFDQIHIYPLEMKCFRKTRSKCISLYAPPFLANTTQGQACQRPPTKSQLTSYGTALVEVMP